MEFAVWIYKPLEEGKIKELLNSKTDLSVKNKQPLSGATAELVLAGSAIQSVKPLMEYRRVRRDKVGFFSEEPFAAVNENSRWSNLKREEEETVGISALQIKGRLYMANSELRDTKKLFAWAAEEPGKDKGYRTVAFAVLQDQDKAEDTPINYRKIVLPLAFVVSYEESYDNKQGMGTFELVVQQSASELTDSEGMAAEIAPKKKDK